MISSIIQPFLKFSQVNKKRNDKESMICLTPKPSQTFFVYRIQSKEIIFTEKGWVKDWRKKWKESFLIALATAIKKDPTTSMRKHANKLKVQEKIIKQNLSPDLNPLDYDIGRVLEDKTNATSHRNIGSLKTAIEKEWNKMSEEFILNACKLFWGYVDTIIEKMAAILSTVTVLYLPSDFGLYGLNFKLFYDRVVYYYYYYYYIPNFASATCIYLAIYVYIYVCACVCVCDNINNNNI